MDGIQGTYREGRIDLDSSVSWPEGTRVEVAPLAVRPAAPDATSVEWGVSDDWADTPENRAEILRRMDAAEPLEMSPEEEAEWQAALDWIGEYTLQAVKRDMGLTP
jgi:hypothetical protein